MIWNLRGTEAQNLIIRDILNRCDFPFDRLLPGLAKERKTSIRVDWEDLTRFNHGAAFHEHAEGAHTISREVEGRQRVLGLFYLPPYTRVVLDASLVNYPTLAQEVFLAEAAHAVDYHYMTNTHRVGVVNALHHQQLPDTHVVQEGEALGLDGHLCSWFDVGPYEAWVGESMMELFVEAFSPLKATIELNHPISPVIAQYGRRLLLGPELTGTARGAAYHRTTCPFIRPSWVKTARTWPTPLDAERAGRRACRVCRPK